jgi:hypothetical protein
MYLYWRVQQDLNCLGEVILFHDLRLIRCHRQWVRRNIGGIALAEEFDMKKLIVPKLN